MINPVITRKSGAYQTEEGCLSLDGVRSCTRYQEIEVDYLDQRVLRSNMGNIQAGQRRLFNMRLTIVMAL